MVLIRPFKAPLLVLIMATGNWLCLAKPQTKYGHWRYPWRGKVRLQVLPDEPKFSSSKTYSDSVDTATSRRHSFNLFRLGYEQITDKWEIRSIMSRRTLSRLPLLCSWKSSAKRWLLQCLNRLSSLFRIRRALGS